MSEQGFNRLTNLPNLPITTGRPVTLPNAPAGVPAVDPKTGKTFREMLEGASPKAPELTFSRHAQQRVEQRSIALTPQDMRRLEEAVGMANQKGITDSLVYLDGTAYIVNIPNRVVVTVVEGGDTAQSIFTNIDGAVIL